MGQDQDWGEVTDRPDRFGRHLKPHRGSTIQTLGILSFFFIPIVLGPMAWVMGNNDLREMDAGLMDPAGRGQTSAGRICGMVSTILAGVSLALVFGFLFCCMGGALLSGGR